MSGKTYLIGVTNVDRSPGSSTFSYCSLPSSVAPGIQTLVLSKGSTKASQLIRLNFGRLLYSSIIQAGLCSNLNSTGT